MYVEFLDDYGDVVESVKAWRAATTGCEDCGEPIAYRFDSDTGMSFFMCRPCIDADEYVRVA